MKNESDTAPGLGQVELANASSACPHLHLCAPLAEDVSLCQRPSIGPWYCPRCLGLATTPLRQPRTRVPAGMIRASLGSSSAQVIRRLAKTFSSRKGGRGSRRVDGGNGKRESDAWSIIRLCPKTTLMSFDDRTADKQPDAHSPALRRVEGIEQRV